MNPDYKTMTDAELKSIISDIHETAERLMGEISALEHYPQGRELREKKEQIISEYANLKSRLKEMYHYTQLGRNDLSGFNFYNGYFCPAIRDCYLSCKAKTNETNLWKLHSSLWEVWSEANYHSGD